MNTIRKLSLIIFLLLNQQYSLFSQQSNFWSYSIKNGLPQSTVFSMLQDKHGYLWVGTNGGGAARFDGKNFKQFSKKNGLAGNVVRCLMEDSKGNLWFGTDEGISVYDGTQFISITKNDSLKGNTVLCFAENKEGKILAGTDDGGLNVIEIKPHPQPLSKGGGGKKVLSFGEDLGEVKISNYATGEDFVNYPVFDILVDPAEGGEKIWLATLHGGILILSEKKDGYELSKPPFDIKIQSTQILCLEKDKEGNLWAGTYDADVFKIASNNEVTHYEEQNGFQGISVWDILVANDNTLWFATGEHGAIHFKNNRFQTYTTKEGLPNNQLACALQDAEGNIWFGTNGDGLCRFGGEHFSHFTFSVKEGFSASSIQGVAQDDAGAIWLATNGGGVMKMAFTDEKTSIQKFNVQNGFVSDNVSAVASGNAQNKNLWFATVKNGIVKFAPDKIGAGGKKFYNYTESDGLQENRVSSILVDSKGIVWCGTANGISRYDGVKFLNASMEKMKMSDEGVKTILEDKDKNIWFGTAGGLARYGGDGSLTTYDEVEGLANKDVNTITVDKEGNIWIGTNGGGLFLFDRSDKDTMPIRFIADDSLLSSGIISALTFIDPAGHSSDGAGEKILLAGTNNGIDKITLDENKKIIGVRSYNASDGFSGVEVNDNSFFRDKEGNIWIGTIQGLTKFSPQKENTFSQPPQVHLTDLKLFYKEVNWAGEKFQTSPWFNLPQQLELPYHKNTLSLLYTGIAYGNPEKIRYAVFLEGHDNDWAPLKAEKQTDYSGLNPGTYTFRVKAVNAEGIWSKEASYTFTILPPWYKTTAFYVACVVFIIIAIVVFIKYRERKLIEEKKVLEQKVKERTAEVVKQKEEIEEQKKVIEEKNKDITDSINYAKRIQEAILPKEEERKNLLQNSFVLFKPKDIVSGDFYWMHEKDDKILFMAADCTGHGVPGAFMSMIGSSLLNQIVGEKKELMPDRILNQLRMEIMKALKQTGAEGESKDGMDAALCRYDKTTRRLYFSGANNSMYLIRRTGDVGHGTEEKNLSSLSESMKAVLENETHQLYEIKADKQPIGYNPMQTSFSLHSMDIQEGDTVYVSSDGYEDQFGGPKGKKFMSKKFKEFLLSIQDKTIHEQFSLVDKTIENWKNYDGKKYEQNDDILVIGVRF